ncbi:hypothetical protein K4L44_06800 [Halosquirtibacter laminarini]|uniref:Uncharacterized protein n=1 Tax=Halosquirtibacter laminarini TaxID=3374600 RepID=A0AC61NII3_9BACT|nr:hypothetical protein K4L44_06800 [Prolixibacteraceae bacterium]
MNQDTKDKLLGRLDVIYTKFNLFIISILTLIFLFHEKLEDMIQTTLVKDRLDHVESDDIHLMVIIIAIVLICVFFVRKYIRRYIFSHKFIVIYSIVTLIYSYYRIGDVRWNFLKITKEGFFDSIVYLDFIYLFAIGLFISRIVNWMTLSKKNTEVLIPDNALSDPKKHQLFHSRAILVDDLSELLINTGLVHELLK